MLTIQLIELVRLNMAANALEADNRIRAAAMLPPGTAVPEAATQAEARVRRSVARAAGSCRWPE